MSAGTGDWCDQLWTEAEKAASGLDGAVVIQALANASEAVWDAGLDAAFGTITSARAQQFDAGWLTLFIVNLHRAKTETK